MLRVEKLTYTVKGRKLLKDVSFQLRKGEVLALLGANGAGKSTLMRLLSRELKADTGVIQLFGKAMHQYDGRELSRCRAMLNQQNHLSLAFSVREIVMMGRYPHFKSQPTAFDQQIVEEVMRACGVDMFAERVYLSLSGGEQQRVQLARVLTQIWDNPDSLLLLDEPISALDLYYQQKVLAIAKALSRRGFMVIVVLHDVNFAASYADRILMLKNGRKLFDGTPIEVLNKNDIYTVFSVETEVAINVQTLKPNVQLQEMVLDVDLFNSAIRNQGETSLSEKIKALLIQNIYYSDRELQRELDISDIELALHDQRNKVAYLSSDFREIIQHIGTLGRLWNKVKNADCQLTKCTRFDEWTMEEHTFAIAQDTRMRLDISSWQVGLSVVNSLTHDLRFYNARGQEVYAVSLGDDPAMLEAYAAICGRFSALVMPNLPTDTSPNCKSLSAEDVFGALGRDYQVSDLVASLYAIGQQRRAYLQNLNADNAQLCDVFYLKRVLNHSVQNGVELTIVVPSPGSQIQYIGKVQHLIDQGNRYIAKIGDMELMLYMDSIYEVWSTVAHTDSFGMICTLELFDGSDNPILQIISRYDGVDDKDNILGVARFVI